MKPRNNFSDELGKVLFESLFDVAQKVKSTLNPRLYCLRWMRKT
jgi:hypothetical protein